MRVPFFNRFLPENIHIKYLKTIIGLDRSAVNIAVLSETGRFPLGICAIKNTIRFWHHLVNLNEKSLAKKAYNDSLNGNIGICNKLQLFFNSLNFNHVWENQNTPSIKGLIRALMLKLEGRYIQYWRTCLTEDNVNYMSKLRCYKDIKHDYKLEKYLLTDVDKKCVSYFVKLRISNNSIPLHATLRGKTLSPFIVRRSP